MREPTIQPPLEIGATFGHYVVEGLVGTGGLSRVYRVRHSLLGSTHALKVLFRRDQDSQRLEREGRAQARLAHPNIVPVTDIVDVEGRTGLIMTFVTGLDIRVWRGKNSPTERQLDWLAHGVLNGVAFAHREGLVHRDLKPANILLGVSGTIVTPQILDFGIVKTKDDLDLTRTGTLLGTPAFMSPEQVRDPKSVDARSDVFALGSVLYFAASGISPFQRPDEFSTLQAVVRSDRVPIRDRCPNLRPSAAVAIEQALSVDPTHRPKDASALLKLWNAEGPLPPPDMVHWAGQLTVGLKATMDATFPPDEVPQTPSTFGDFVPRKTRSPWPVLIGVPILAVLLLVATLRTRSVVVDPVREPPPSPASLPDVSAPTPVELPHPSTPVPPKPPIPTKPIPLPNPVPSITPATPRQLPDPAVPRRVQRPTNTTNGFPVAWVSDAGRFEQGDVPPGSYDLYVLFDGEMVERLVGHIERVERVSYRVDCVPLTRTCSITPTPL